MTTAEIIEALCSDLNLSGLLPADLVATPGLPVPVALEKIGRDGLARVAPALFGNAETRTRGGHPNALAFDITLAVKTKGPAVAVVYGLCDSLIGIRNRYVPKSGTRLIGIGVGGSLPFVATPEIGEAEEPFDPGLQTNNTFSSSVRIFLQLPQSE